MIIPNLFLLLTLFLGLIFALDLKVARDMSIAGEAGHQQIRKKDPEVYPSQGRNPVGLLKPNVYLRQENGQ